MNIKNVSLDSFEARKLVYAGSFLPLCPLLTLSTEHIYVFCVVRLVISVFETFLFVEVQVPEAVLMSSSLFSRNVTVDADVATISLRFKENFGAIAMRFPMLPAALPRDTSPARWR